MQLGQEVFLHGDVRVQRAHDGAELVNLAQEFLIEGVEHGLEGAEAAGHVGVQNGQQLHLQKRVVVVAALLALPPGGLVEGVAPEREAQAKQAANHGHRHAPQEALNPYFIELAAAR